MAQVVIEGLNPVAEALRAGRRVSRVFVLEGQGRRHQAVAELACSKGVPVERVGRKRLDRLSETGEHQGAVALAEPLGYSSIKEVLAFASEKSEPPFVVVLDGIEDPQNLGAILRSCEGAGVHGVVIPNKGLGLSPGVIKASAGAVEHVRLVRTNLAQCLDRLREEGLTVIGASSEAVKSVFEADLRGAVALAVGGEDSGLSRGVEDECDVLVSIPMRGKMRCLNASVAAAILVYEKRRQDARL